MNPLLDRLGIALVLLMLAAPVMAQEPAQAVQAPGPETKAKAGGGKFLDEARKRDQAAIDGAPDAVHVIWTCSRFDILRVSDGATLEILKKLGISASKTAEGAHWHCRMALTNLKPTAAELIEILESLSRLAEAEPNEGGGP